MVTVIFMSVIFFHTIFFASAAKFHSENSKVALV